jgi:hypothetical protein
LRVHLAVVGGRATLVAGYVIGDMVDDADSAERDGENVVHRG